MARVTQTYLKEWVEELQGQGCDISISWAYGKPRCYNKEGNREKSPRLPTGEMKTWLEGYCRGREDA